MDRRSFIGAMVAAAAGAKSAMAQEPAQKLSDGDVEKRLNQQLGELMEIAKTMPEFQGITIPPMKVKSVKHTKQKFSDIEIEKDGGTPGPAVLVLSRDILEKLEPDRQMALVANAASQHLLELNSEKLKSAGMTRFSENLLARGANLGQVEKDTLAKTALPLRIDEMAVKMLEKNPKLGNGAKDYYFMLVKRKEMEEGRSDSFFTKLAAQPAPKAPKNEKDERKQAMNARAQVAEMMKDLGQDISFRGGGFSASVPIDYRQRLEQVYEVHPRSREVSSNEINPPEKPRGGRF